jgi:hypothetical protein
VLERVVACSAGAGPQSATQLEEPEGGEPNSRITCSEVVPT